MSELVLWSSVIFVGEKKKKSRWSRQNRKWSSSFRLRVLVFVQRFRYSLCGYIKGFFVTLLRYLLVAIRSEKCWNRCLIFSTCLQVSILILYRWTRVVETDPSDIHCLVIGASGKLRQMRETFFVDLSTRNVEADACDVRIFAEVFCFGGARLLRQMLQIWDFHSRMFSYWSTWKGAAAAWCLMFSLVLELMSQMLTTFMIRSHVLHELMLV